MSRYQTGDLFLANQWSVSSILNHAVDPTSRWSDAGIFLVEQPAARDRTTSGYLPNGKGDDLVRVIMMTPSGVKILSLDEILKIPSFQAAAHRPLAVEGRKPIQQAMTGYILNVIKAIESNPKRIVSNPFPSALKESLTGQPRTQYTRSSHGTLLDSKGRDLKVSGFVKGNPDSQIKVDFTPADFIGSILAQAELIHYDPEILISDFQEGGHLDAIYGNEVPLFPRKPAENIREYLLHKARQEAELLVMSYFEAVPVSTFGRYKNSNSSNGLQFEPDVESTELPEEEDGNEFGTGYPDQTRAAYSMAAARERRGNTNAMALTVESDTIDQKIRQRVDEAGKYSRPAPSYRKKIE